MIWCILIWWFGLGGFGECDVVVVWVLYSEFVYVVGYYFGILGESDFVVEFFGQGFD